jgi:exosortase
VSLSETKNKPSILGLLWPHEIPLIAVIAYGFYQTKMEFRGLHTPVAYFGAGILAMLVLLALRSLEDWRALPNKVFFFSLAAVWVGFFCVLGNSTFGYVDSNSIFRWVFDIYTTSDADIEFGLIIPFIVLILYWWRRKELLALPISPWPKALIWIAAALFLHLVGYTIQQPRLSYLSFFIGLYGLTGLAWGKAWFKASFFPYFLLIFCVPLLGTNWLTLKMRLMVSWIVASIAHLGLAPDLVRDGTALIDAEHSFGFEVAAACSGIRSLTALLALTTIYGFMVFKSPWKRAVMILSAFPLSIVANVCRLCFTIVVSELGGQSWGKAVESNAGFVTFAVAILGVYGLANRLEKPQPKPEVSAP